MGACLASAELPACLHVFVHGVTCRNSFGNLWGMGGDMYIKMTPEGSRGMCGMYRVRVSEAPRPATLMVVCAASDLMMPLLGQAFASLT